MSADDRAAQIKQVISDYLQVRDTAPVMSNTELITAHADLMPDLAEDLRKVRLTGSRCDTRVEWPSRRARRT